MLTNARIRNLKPESRRYKMSDGEGLFIIVLPNGAKYWRLKYRFADKEKTLSLGRFPEISLQEAREKKFKARELLRQNKNPSQEKREQKILLRFLHDHDFKAVATDWFDVNRDRWDPGHAAKLWRRLEMHAFPQIGFRAMAEIKPLEILNMIRIIERAGSTETAHSVYGMCNRIFRYAVVIGITEHNPAANLSGGLRPNRHKGYPVIPVSEIPQFLLAFNEVNIRQQDRLAFRLLLLTALRTGELRHSKWSYISREQGILKIPASIMKMREDHIVPLSQQALATLDELAKFSGNQEWLFPNPYQGRYPVVQENFINRIISDMGYKGRMVGHSFRKLFSTVLNEHEFPVDAIERQLAHRERNGVRAAYNHAQYLKTRRFLMQWWADYLDYAVNLEKGNTLLDLRNLPAGRASPNFNRLRVDPNLDASVPRTFADGYESQRFLEPNDAFLN